MKAVPRIDLVCEHCGGGFQRTEAQLRANGGKRTFCSVVCSRAARTRAVERICATCGKAFARKASAQEGRAAYCSRRCWLGRGAKPTTYRKIGGRHAHRVIAERKLGRPLRPGEVVHHIDGDQHNNDPANLEVLLSQADHARRHVPPGTRVGGQAA